MEQHKLSFSWTVKSELMQKQLADKKDILSELMVFIRVCGSLSIGSGIVFEVDRPSYAKRLYSHIKAVYGISPKIHLKRFNRLGKTYKYFIRISDKHVCNAILKDTMYMNNSGELVIIHGIKKSLRRSSRERQNILRAAFLLCGSVSSPEKNYHMEMVFADGVLANDIAKTIEETGLGAKVINRKNSAVVYLKGAEEIVDFLTFIGASGSILDFYNIKIIKEMRNNVNRVVNCETANIGKTVNAASRQLESINTIKEKKGLLSLPADLYEAASLRLANPDMPLKDLAKMCDPVISKSGLNHRFKRIDKIAGELK